MDSYSSHRVPWFPPSSPSFRRQSETRDVPAANSSSASSLYHSAEFETSVQAHGQPEGTTVAVDVTRTSEIDVTETFEVGATETFEVDGTERDLEAGPAIASLPDDTLDENVDYLDG